MAGKPSDRLHAENERLASENEELRLRLEEAEQALEAIRTGQAESLIVEGPDGPRIFSLEGADHSYRVLVEAMNEGAATFGEDGTVLYCNARFADLVDAPLERIMASEVSRFVPEHSREAFEALVREATGGESRGEIELVSDAGKPVPAFLSVSVIHDATGRRYCLVAADLRAQKRNEEIVAAERLARSVLEQAADAIVVCDESGRIIRASNSARELCVENPLLAPFGHALPLELPAADGRSGQEDLLASAARGEVLRGVPASLALRDGSRAQLLVSATALYGSGRGILGYVVTLVDVTGLRRAEEALRQALASAEERGRLLESMMEALRESEGRFRSVLADSRDLIYRFNVQTRRFEYVSPAARAVVGVSSEELMALDDDATQTMIHPDDAPAMRDALERLERTGNAEAEYRQRTRDGDDRWLSNRMSLVRDGEGRPLHRNGTIRDITQRKRAEEALRRANLELAEADRRKNDFLAVLSHELRNPLTPIRNSTYILERAAPGGDQARRAVEVIDRQAGQLARLVDDLLDVTRISRNKIQLQRRRLELNEMVRRTMEDQRSLFDGAGVRLEFLPAPAPLFVDADWNRLAQVVGNLLQNAAKFTGRGGTARLELHADEATGRAVIRVSDTGVGMTPEMVARLFEPFSQAESTLDRSKGGLGLGLALVKSIVELHGGDVTARSAGPGKGAEFVVRLPAAIEDVAAAPKPEDRRAARDRRRVLVIEDNVDAANSLREVLELGEHEVAVARDGAEGLATARAFRPDIVLCDIGLPGMDGYEVARAFRADEALKGLFLVALSGYALPGDLQRAEEAGFDRHLAKPPRLEKVKQLLDGLPAPAAPAARPSAAPE